MSGTIVATRLQQALTLHRRGAIAEAALVYQSVLADQPGNADALHLLGMARRSQGQGEEAVTLIRQALRLAPAHVEAWYNLGNALSSLERFAEATEAYREATALRPNHAEAWYNQAIALARLDQASEAIGAYERALALQPRHIGARHNLANLLIETGRPLDGIRGMREVLALEPGLPEAHYNLALALLRMGDYGLGFKEYEWRWQSAGFPSLPRHTALASWDGGRLAGRRLLVHAEQGLGDTLQFVRLVALLRPFGGSITLEVPAPLVRLLEGVAGADRVIAQARTPADVDLGVPLMSLPHRLGLTLGAIPRRGAYLQAPPDRVAAWRRCRGGDGQISVGLCWRGNPLAPIDRGRSIGEPALLEPLTRVNGVRLISLLKLTADDLVAHDGATGWRVAGLPFTLEHPGPEYDVGEDAFLDAAGVMMNLDLIISTDTALAHLAAALGRPTWLMLRHVADWRWLTRRSDSPWYPSLRLFRQPAPGDWRSVIATVAETLAQLRPQPAAAA